MNIFRLAFELFIVYMVYKLVFDFIIPVYNTTRQMKQKMGEMQSKMKDHHSQNSAPPSSPQPNTPKARVADDYIEYEEIK